MKPFDRLPTITIYQDPPDESTIRHWYARWSTAKRISTAWYIGSVVTISAWVLTVLASIVFPVSVVGIPFIICSVAGTLFWLINLRQIQQIVMSREAIDFVPIDVEQLSNLAAFIDIPEVKKYLRGVAKQKRQLTRMEYKAIIDVPHQLNQVRTIQINVDLVHKETGLAVYSHPHHDTN